MINHYNFRTFSWWLFSTSCFTYLYYYGFKILKNLFNQVRFYFRHQQRTTILLQVVINKIPSELHQLKIMASNVNNSCINELMVGNLYWGDRWIKTRRKTKRYQSLQRVSEASLIGISNTIVIAFKCFFSQVSSIHDQIICCTIALKHMKKCAKKMWKKNFRETKKRVRASSRIFTIMRSWSSVGSLTSLVTIFGKEILFLLKNSEVLIKS